MTDRTNNGVRNLRAMFENQNAPSSPEPRGQSPAGNDDSAVRPTAKVRASFVSVVPNQPTLKDLGTTKGVSINSPQAQRRESFSVGEDLEGAGPSELKKFISQEKDDREKSTLVAEAVPEQAVETRESSRDPPPIHEAPQDMPNLGSIMKGSDFPEPSPTTDHLPTEAGAEQPPIQAEETPATPSSPDEPADNPDKIMLGAQGETFLKPADPTDAAAVSGGLALPPPTEDLASSSTTQPAIEEPEAASAPEETKTASTLGESEAASTLEESKTNSTIEEPKAASTVEESKAAPTLEEPKAVPTPKAAASPSKANGTTSTPGKATTKKPSAISIAKASTTKTSSARSPLPKSPGAARLPRTPTTVKPTPAPATSAPRSPAPVKAQPKPAVKAPAPKASRTSIKTSTTTTAPTTKSAAKPKAPVTEVKKPTTSKPVTTASSSKDAATTSPSGFKKPRPKSPTRPVRLPSHLIAPTASSAAKHGEEAAAQKVARKPSTVTRPPSKAATATKKPSSRASLGPAMTTTKRPDSRASTNGAPNEGFLARMMRPTTASASKTLDKPPSPPRKSTAGRVPVKSKGHESAVAKGKKKVEQIAEKVKDVVTNGHSDEKAADGNTEEHADTDDHVEENAVSAEPANTQTSTEASVENGAAEESVPAATSTEANATSTVKV
jgi:hypothetical protein